MNWATRRLLIPALCLFSAIAAHASDTAPAPVTDPVLVGDHYRQVLQRPEFQAPADIDADARFKDWLSQWFLHLGSRLSEFQYSQELHSFSLFLIAVLLMLTLAGLLYIVVRFSRRRGFREEVEPTGTPGQKKFRPPEFYNEEIRKAVADGDWHDAWLVTWRQFLSRLENRRLVEADRTRTNREYLAQLREQSIPPSIFTLIARMVDAYDRFIYGCSPIGKTEWDLFHQQVDEATLLLHLDAKMTRPGEKQEAA